MMIMLLACILFGLGWGNSLDSQMAGICKMFGLCGFAFYFCLELVAYHRERHRARLVKWVAERRLSQHVEIQVEESQAYSDPGAPAGVLPLASAGHRD